MNVSSRPNWFSVGLGQGIASLRALTGRTPFLNHHDINHMFLSNRQIKNTDYFFSDETLFPDVVVVGGCSDLCGALTEKTGSETLGVACSILCDIVGSDVFVDVIRK